MCLCVCVSSWLICRFYASHAGPSFELFVNAPAVEALGKPLRFVVAARQEQLARLVRLLGAHMLTVNLRTFQHRVISHRIVHMPAHRNCAYLRRFVCQLHLHLAAPCAQPQKDLLAIIQYHNVIVGQIVLTEVGALLCDGEVALLVGAAEQTCVLHVVGVRVVGLAATQRHPEEVLRFLALVENLRHNMNATLSLLIF